MKIQELITQYVNKDRHPRQLGRYWATDIYGIIKGFITPENFFEEREIDENGASMILTGKANEEMLSKILKEMNINFEEQVKKEIQINDEIVLVVKPDFIFQDFIIETKYVFKPFEKIPDRYRYQLECEYRAFYKPVYLGILSSPFDLNLMLYKPNKALWKKIKLTLEDFHNKLKVATKINM